MYVNLDEGLEEPAWEAYVRQLGDDGESAVGVGVVTLNEPLPEIRERFLFELQVTCGFVVLKIGAAKTTEILVKTLEANEARGRRKFVRAPCPPGVGQCSIVNETKTVRGEITDISSAGVAIRLGGDQSFRVGMVLRGISIAVKGVRVLADGFIVAQRTGSDGANIHVLMFDPTSLDEEHREKLRSLVCRLNQAAMDQLIATA